MAEVHWPAGRAEPRVLRGPAGRGVYARRTARARAPFPAAGRPPVWDRQPGDARRRGAGCLMYDAMDEMDEFEAHRPLLFGIAYRMLGSVTDAEDILQDAYLRYAAVPRDSIQAPRAF